jgi:hypothetical protein
MILHASLAHQSNTHLNGRSCLHLVRQNFSPLIMRHSGLFILTLLVVAGLHAEPVPVRHPQGSAHGFLALSALDGTRIAIGDVTQVIHGSQVTSRVIVRFRDGSVDADTTVFSQRGTFRLISDHHIQRGPSFPKPIDILIDALTGRDIRRSSFGDIVHVA